MDYGGYVEPYFSPLLDVCFSQLAASAAAMSKQVLPPHLLSLLYSWDKGLGDCCYLSAVTQNTISMQ